MPCSVRSRPKARRATLLSCALLAPALLVPGALGGCGAGYEEGAQLGQLVAGLANGVADDAHPAVGLIIAGASDCAPGASAGAKRCTGTLVGRHTVVTAGHCVQDSTLAYAFCPVGGATRAVARALAHPGYLATQQLGVKATTDDIGLLILRDEVLDIPAAVVANRAPVRGETGTVVGWGVMSERGDKPADRPQSGSKAITAVSAKVLETEPAVGLPGVCTGDSGGPVLAREGDRDVLLGVVSISVSANNGLCSTGTEYYTRADVYRDWIAATPGADLRSLEDLVSATTSPEENTYRLLFDGLDQPTAAPTTTTQLDGALGSAAAASPSAASSAQLGLGGEEVEGVTCNAAPSGAAVGRGRGAGALPWMLTLLALVLHARRRSRPPRAASRAPAWRALLRVRGA
ncbi:MAG: trypsin-like serine protease [Proteobacteria bacterium]|nr:trypsin-like serine protease [Pseudomonadota bacterium]